MTSHRPGLHRRAARAGMDFMDKVALAIGYVVLGLLVVVGLSGVAGIASSTVAGWLRP